MISPEFPNGRPAFVTEDLVYTLKDAISVMQVPAVKWSSTDGEAIYQAAPVDLYDDGIEGLFDKLADLPKLPSYEFKKIMNVWVFDRIATNRGKEKPMRVDQMFVKAGAILLSVSVEYDPLDPDFDETRVQAQLNNIKREDSHDGSLEDYAILENAIKELEPLRDEAWRAYDEARLNMTDQEKRLERMAKFKWLITPEHDKTQGPGWWAISESSFLHTVRASSPDEAAAKVDEYHEENGGLGILPFFFVERLPDDVSEKFDAELDQSSVVRLIPYSNVPYQKPGESLTPEQQEAWDFIERVQSKRK